MKNVEEGKLHYYKSVRFDSDKAPVYVVRDFSNGITGYKGKLHKELADSLNFVYIGHHTQREIGLVMKERLSSYKRGFSSRVRNGRH